MNALDYAALHDFRMHAHNYLVQAVKEPKYLLFAWQSMREMYRVMTQVASRSQQEAFEEQFNAARRLIGDELARWRQCEEFGEPFFLSEEVSESMSMLFDNLYRLKAVTGLGLSTERRVGRSNNPFAQGLSNRGGGVKPEGD